MTRRKDGLYQEVLMVNGKKKYFYGKTKAEVLRKIRAYQEKEEAGILFGEVAEKWWEEHEATLAYNTAKSYRPAKERCIEVMGQIPIKNITALDVNQYIIKFAKTYADKTVRTQLMMFNLIFKYAAENNWITHNPVRELSVPPKLKKKKISSPSSDDLARVKNSCECTFGLFAYLALYTGMRKGEILALHWDDIDLEARTISITKSVVFKGNQPAIKSTKTENSNRVVPILDALLPKLPEKKQKGWLFQGRNGGLMTSTEWQTKWKKYRKESGVQCTMHQLRHAYATMLFENGVSEKDAQDLLGHAQLSTTMDIYTDIRNEHRQKMHRNIYNLDIV